MNTQKNTIKMVLLSLLIAVVDIFCFSKAGLGLSFSSPSVFQKSLSITILLMSIGVFFYGNGRLLFAKEPVQEDPVEEETVSPAARYIRELKGQFQEKTYASDAIEKAVQQYEEFLRKSKALKRVIKLNDNQSEATLIDAMEDVETSLGKNFRLILSRLLILDYDEKARYEREYRGFVEERLQKNEEILNLFDSLLDEVSRMKDDLDMEDINLLSTIDALKSIRTSYEESPAEENIFGDWDDERMKLIYHDKSGEGAIYVGEKISQTFPSSSKY